MKMHLKTLATAMATVGLLSHGLVYAQADASHPTGNVVFLHPDGLSVSHWTAARAYWKGPDAALHWDRLPQMAVYRGHMSDLMTGTSHGGATTHAFGYKVSGLGSFGKDGDGNLTPPTDRSIKGLSGFDGSILREAAHRGHPTGLVNDGNIGEPGTGAFAAEVGNRDNWNAIALQIIAGRAGTAPASASSERAPAVILGGGERNFLPQGTPACAAGSARTETQQGMSTFPLACKVHTLDWGKANRLASPDRTDGRNLIAEAAAAGYLVIRTRSEFDAVMSRLQADRNWAPRVLGLFASHHTFNDRNEEDLIAAGFRDASIPATDKRSNLVLFGNPSPADAGFNPPRADEMTRMAMIVLARHANQLNRPYLLVAEPESADNFGNRSNAIGSLTAARIADDMIGVVLEAQRESLRPPFGPLGTRFPTTVLVAADSNSGALQLNGLRAATATVGSVVTNEASGLPEVNNPLDGLYGRNSPSFATEPDRFGRVMHFGIAWAGGPDFADGIIVRAATQAREGRRGAAGVKLQDFSTGFDNTDVYRFKYAHLFGRLLPPATTAAPSR